MKRKQNNFGGNLTKIKRSKTESPYNETDSFDDSGDSTELYVPSTEPSYESGNDGSDYDETESALTSMDTDDSGYYPSDDPEEQVTESRVREPTVSNQGGVTEQNTPTVPPTIEKVYRECPEFIDLIAQATSIPKEVIIDINKPRSVNGLEEMIPNLPLDYLALQRSGNKTELFDYRYKPSNQPRVTDQHHSGRCWLFASLNQLRYATQLVHNLSEKFEFSASYLFFWDKIERSNVFLEGIWSLRDKALDNRYVTNVFMHPEHHLIKDGGYWSYFTNLVNKYGLLPKSVYNDSYHCYDSDGMNDALMAILNKMGLEIRQGSQSEGWSREDFDRKKKEYMTRIYDLVVKFMGAPPQTFDWVYTDKSEEYVCIKNLTPRKFFQLYVPHNFETKMTFIHDPRHPEKYYCPYYVEYGTNVVGGRPCVFINLPLSVFKRAIAESLILGEPCWFACDVGSCLDFNTGVLSTERFNYKKVLGTDICYDKVDMMNAHISAPSHAMVINGVDMDPPEDNYKHDDIPEDPSSLISAPKPPVYRRWRIENSWGIPCEMEWHPDKGCWQMTDEWFDKYVYMAVIDLKYFEQDTLSKIIKNSKKAHPVKPWDVFGTVATHRGCSSCKHRSPGNRKIDGSKF